MIGKKPPADPGWWAPVVYGRTASADLWWRALPEAIDPMGREAYAVLAAVDGGRGLTRSPRFVLVRGHIGTLVGVACMARELSEAMNSDGSRPLYCFIGWFSGDTRVAVPPLADLESDWRPWAAEDYEHWMRPAWTEHPSKLRKPALTVPEAPPWPASSTWQAGAPELPPETVHRILQPAPGQVRAHPAARRLRVWQAVACHGPSAVLVTGWASVQDANLNGVTDVCADDVNELRLLRAPGRDKQPTREASSRPEPLRPAAQPGPSYSPKQVAGSPPGTARHDQRDSGPGLRLPRPRNLDPLRVVRGVAGRILGDPGHGPPPPPEAPGAWTYNAGKDAFYSRDGEFHFRCQVGGSLTCWTSHKFFRWEHDHWVEQVPAPGADAEDEVPDRRATAPPAVSRQMPDRQTLEQSLNAEFADFEKTPLPGTASDQYSSSGESAPEPEDSRESEDS